MMHDFNSVSGMWSEIQLKGRGGWRGGEGTNVEGIKEEKRGGRRGAWMEEGGGRLHSSTLPPVRGFFGRARDGGERGRKVEGGGEGWSAGEGPVWLLSASHVSKPVLKNE